MNRRARRESGIPVLTMAYNHHCNTSHVSKGKKKKIDVNLNSFIEYLLISPKTPAY